MSAGAQHSPMVTCSVCGTTIRVATLGHESTCPTCGTFIEPPQPVLAPTADFIPTGGPALDLVTPRPRPASTSRELRLSPVQATYRFSLLALALAATGALLLLCGALAGDGTPFGLGTFSLSCIVAAVSVTAFVIAMIDPDILETRWPLGISRLRAGLAFIPLAAVAGFVAWKTFSP